MSRRKRKRRPTRPTAKPEAAKRAVPSSVLRKPYVVLLIISTAVGLTVAIAFLIPRDEPNAPGAVSDPQPANKALVTDDDPTKDGWDSEVLSDAAARQLKKLAKVLLAGHNNLDGIQDLLAASFSGTSLRPAKFTRVYDVDGLEIRHFTHSPSKGSPNIGEPSATRLTKHEWLETAAQFSDLFADAKNVSFELKVFRFFKHKKGFETHARLQASTTKDATRLQVQAIWRCRWDDSEDNGTQRIADFEVIEHEEVVNQRSSAPLFADCTKSVMGHNACYAGQLVPSYEQWFRRTQRVFDRKLWADHGLAIGDVNGDGRDDVYVCEPGSLPNRLLVQNEDGTVTDASASAGVDWLDHTRCALFVDLDNDGDQDLAIAINGMILLMSNDGKGKFSLRAEIRDVPAAHSMAAVDYDADGLIDIYACSYFKDASGPFDYAIPIPYHNATNGGHNALLRNMNHWKFKNVTSDVGLDEVNNRFSLAASWDDYDNDGDLDLYVANDWGPNCLYNNDGGKFKNVAAAAGVEDVGSGMSVAWGDYNRDGLMDLYVSNMFSSAGSRITFQHKFKPDVSRDQKAMFQRMAKGNTLFLNVGNGTFRDVSHEASVAMARWAWAAPFLDINNDGWQDLIVANGFITRDSSQDL